MKVIHGTSMVILPVVLHEAVPEVSKGREYSPEEHAPIESFATTLVDEPFFLMTRTKLASVGFVAARNCMRQQVLDDAKYLPKRGRSQPATTCDSSYALNSGQYYALLQRTTKYYSVLQSSTVVLQYYSLLHSNTHD